MGIPSFQTHIHIVLDVVYLRGIHLSWKSLVRKIRHAGGKNTFPYVSLVFVIHWRIAAIPNEYPQFKSAKIEIVKIVFIPMCHRNWSIRNRNPQFSFRQVTKWLKSQKHSLGPIGVCRHRKIHLRLRPSGWQQYPGCQLKKNKKAGTAMTQTHGW